jgi:hypothetical protein
MKDGFAFATYPEGADRAATVRVILAESEAVPSRPLALARKAGLIDTSTHKATFELASTVEWREIDRVLDLRRPEARQFLFQKFGNGDGDWVDYSGRPVPEATGFHGLLSTLMDRNAGGNTLTDQIAGYLRTMGTSALIFPSARSNVLVSWKNSEMIGFRGWNLVDWSGETAPPKKSLKWITDWNPPLDGGVRIVVAPEDSPYRGSFRVENNEEHHLWLLHLLMVFGVAERKPDTGWITGYRWHAGRMLSSGPRYLARCLSCSDETDCGSTLGSLPHQCPKCGHREVSVP